MSQKVLVVDDSKSVQMLIESRLRDEGVELRFADNGTDALRIASEWSPDLVLLDVDMPQHGGFEVCTWLKQDATTQQIPVVFMSGAISLEEKIRGLDLGAADYITKPFDTAELRARVRASLRTKHLIDLLAKKAQIDGLTGLWNRAHFDARLAQEAALTHRTGLSLSILLLDCDHFKTINDRFGQLAGDQVIQSVAQTLRDSGRSTDILCRYHGDVFGIIATNTQVAGAAVLAERMRECVEQLSLRFRQTDLKLTTSVGVAQVDSEPLQAVFAADAAVQHAKQLGRNRVESAAITAASAA